jgi:hypothetical protein
LRSALPSGIVDDVIHDQTGAARNVTNNRHFSDFAGFPRRLSTIESGAPMRCAKSRARATPPPTSGETTSSSYL